MATRKKGRKLAGSSETKSARIARDRRKLRRLFKKLTQGKRSKGSRAGTKRGGNT